MNSPCPRVPHRTFSLCRRSFYRNASFSPRKTHTFLATGPPCWTQRAAFGWSKYCNLVSYQTQYPDNNTKISLIVKQTRRHAVVPPKLFILFPPHSKLTLVVDWLLYSRFCTSISILQRHSMQIYRLSPAGPAQ